MANTTNVPTPTDLNKAEDTLTDFQKVMIKIAERIKASQYGTTLDKLSESGGGLFYAGSARSGDVKLLQAMVAIKDQIKNPQLQKKNAATEYILEKLQDIAEEGLTADAKESHEMIKQLKSLQSAVMVGAENDDDKKMLNELIGNVKISIKQNGSLFRRVYANAREAAPEKLQEIVEEFTGSKFAAKLVGGLSKGLISILPSFEKNSAVIQHTKDLLGITEKAYEEQEEGNEVEEFHEKHSRKIARVAEESRSESAGSSKIEKLEVNELHVTGKVERADGLISSKPISMGQQMEQDQDRKESKTLLGKIFKTSNEHLQVSKKGFLAKTGGLIQDILGTMVRGGALAGLLTSALPILATVATAVVTAGGAALAAAAGAFIGKKTYDSLDNKTQEGVSNFVGKTADIVGSVVGNSESIDRLNGPREENIAHIIDQDKLNEDQLKFIRPLLNQAFPVDIEHNSDLLQKLRSLAKPADVKVYQVRKNERDRMAVRDYEPGMLDIITPRVAKELGQEKLSTEQAKKMSELQDAGIGDAKSIAAGIRAAGLKDAKSANADVQQQLTAKYAAEDQGKSMYAQGVGVHGLIEALTSGETKSGMEGYNQVYGGAVKYGTPESMFGKPLSELTFGQVKQWQAASIKAQHAAGVDANHTSSAVGKGQFIKSTLAETQQAAGLSDNDVFSPENQDKLIMTKLNQLGLKDYMDGKISAETLMKRVSQTWASVKDLSGHGQDDGIGANHASVSGQGIIGLIDNFKDQAAKAMLAQQDKIAAAGGGANGGVVVINQGGGGGGSQGGMPGLPNYGAANPSDNSDTIRSNYWGAPSYMT